MFLDYFKKKKEDGIKSDNMFQQFRYLRKVYLYLFSHEFESTNVEEYMKMVSDGSDNQSDPGICPHCGEVICFVFCISVVFSYYIQGSLKKFLNPFCFACTLGLLPCLPFHKAK